MIVFEDQPNQLDGFPSVELHHLANLVSLCPQTTEDKSDDIVLYNIVVLL